MIVKSVDSYEIVESYPKDKYLPSFLVYARHEQTAFHILFAVDFDNDSVKVVTAYRPEIALWNSDFKRRRKP